MTLFSKSVLVLDAYTLTDFYQRKSGSCYDPFGGGGVSRILLDVCWPSSGIRYVQNRGLTTHSNLPSRGQKASDILYWNILLWP